MRNEKLVEVRVRLERDSLSKPWGFRLVGGVDFNSPVVVQRVSTGSPADNVLLKDDIIQSIDNYDVTNMTNKQVEDVLRTAGKELMLFFLRPASNQFMLDETASTLAREKRQAALVQAQNFNQASISQVQGLGKHLSAFSAKNATSKSRETTPSFLRPDHSESQGPLPFRSPSVNRENNYNTYSSGKNYQGANHVEVFVEPRHGKGATSSATPSIPSYLQVPGQQNHGNHDAGPKEISVTKMSACPGGTLFPHTYLRYKNQNRASSVTPSVRQRPASVIEVSRCATPDTSARFKSVRPLSTSDYASGRGSQISYLVLPVRNCRVILPQTYSTYDTSYQPQQQYYQPQVFVKRTPSFHISPQGSRYYATTPTFNRSSFHPVNNNFSSYRPCPIMTMSSS